MYDRSATLWVVTLVIIGLFAAAAVITPTVVDELNDSGTDEPGGNTTRTGMDYQMPVLETGLSEMKEDVSYDVVLSAQPDRGFLTEGGEWTWVFQVSSDAITVNDVVIHYSGSAREEYVGWMTPPGATTLVGYGHQFSQGPSTTMSKAETRVNLTIYRPGDYSISVWIMDKAAIAKGGLPSPSSELARSPALMVQNTVESPPEPRVSVDQSFSWSTKTARTNQAVRYTISDSADRGETKWEGTVVDYVAVDMEGIRATDVNIKITSPSGRASIVDQGDRLITKLTETAPWGDGSEDTEWSVSFELTFTRTGTYTVHVWAEDKATAGMVSEDSSVEMTITRTNTTPTPPPSPTPNNTTPTSSAAPTGTVSMASISTTPAMVAAVGRAAW